MEDDTGPWARAGIFVRNDLGLPGSDGFVRLAVTPDHGVVPSWAAGGDGRIETPRQGPASPAPVWLLCCSTGSR